MKISCQLYLKNPLNFSLVVSAFLFPSRLKKLQMKKLQRKFQFHLPQLGIDYFHFFLNILAAFSRHSQIVKGFLQCRLICSEEIRAQDVRYCKFLNAVSSQNLFKRNLKLTACDWKNVKKSSKLSFNYLVHIFQKENFISNLAKIILYLLKKIHFNSLSWLYYNSINFVINFLDHRLRFFNDIMFIIVWLNVCHPRMSCF